MKKEESYYLNRLNFSSLQQKYNIALKQLKNKMQLSNYRLIKKRRLEVLNQKM